MSDKIQFTCPHCSHQMQLPSSTVGKQGKCPGCGEVVTITASQPVQSSQQQPLGPPPDSLAASHDQQLPVQSQPLAHQSLPQQTAPHTVIQQPVSQLSPEQKDVDTGRASNKKPFLIGAGVGGGLGVMATALLFMILGGDDSKPTSDVDDKPTTNATLDVDPQQVDSNSSVQDSPAVLPVAPEAGTVAINLSSPEALGESYLAALKISERSQSEALSVLMTPFPSDAELRRLSETMKSNAATDGEKEECDRFIRNLTEWSAQCRTNNKKSLEEIFDGINGNVVPAKWSEVRLIVTISDYDPATSKPEVICGVKTTVNDSIWVFVVFEANGDRFGLLIDEVYSVDDKWYLGDNKWDVNLLRKFAVFHGGEIKELLEMKNDPSLAPVIRELQ